MVELYQPGDRIRQEFDIRIVEKIGEGGMGEVYEAVLYGASGFEKRIALKVVRAEFLGEEFTGGKITDVYRADEFLARLVNEAKLVSNLIHTHITQIYLLGIARREAGQHIGFIAMEYVQGINLRAFIDQHRAEGREVPFEIAVYIASRLARALQHAHSAADAAGQALGIVHRDVSPTNVLLSIEGVVKLTDFGIAKAVHFDSAPRDYIVGKKRYMAPEQYERGAVDFRADLYSLGLILRELVTGTPLLTGGAAAAMPPAIAELAASLTSLKPQDRPAPTGRVAELLERAIYEKGYGPTFVTLAAYLNRLFPALKRGAPATEPAEATVIETPLPHGPSGGEHTS